MARTVADLISASLREITVLAEGETASSDMVNDSLLIFSELLQSWSEIDVMIPYEVSETFTLVTTKKSYVIAPGGDFNTASPIDIISAAFLISGVSLNIQVTDSRGLANVNLRNVTSQPRLIYLDRQTVNPTINFDVFPYGGQLELISRKPLLSIYTLTATTLFPEAYARMLRTNLAIDLAPGYRKSITPELSHIAAESLNIVKRRNAKPIPSMRSDVPTRSGHRADLPLR